MRRTLITLILVMFTWSAFAHSPLQSTTPADGATLSTVPTQIVMTFKRKIRLTRVTVSRNDGDPQPLDLAGQTKFVTEFTIPLIGTDAGEHTVEWRGLGDDGHAQKGSFRFTVE